MAPVVNVGQDDFEQRVVGGSREVPVVVDFWAGWCRPCLVLGPILERLAEEYEGRFVLAKVDVDANPALAARFRIQGIPAVKAFRDGDVVSEFVGAQPEEVVRRFLDVLVPSQADDLVAEARAVEERGDLEAAEAAYRRAIAVDPGHAGAAAGLAGVLLATGRVAEARSALAAVAPSPEVRAVQARLELLDAADSASPILREAAGLAAAGEHRRALDRALEALTSDGDRDAARELMVHVFEVLGDEHPLTREYRPRLARALF
jgi:putative thioredoxin